MLKIAMESWLGTISCPMCKCCTLPQLHLGDKRTVHLPVNDRHPIHYDKRQICYYNRLTIVCTGRRPLPSSSRFSPLSKCMCHERAKQSECAHAVRQGHGPKAWRMVSYLPLHLCDPDFLLFLAGMSRTELTTHRILASQLILSTGFCILGMNS